MIPLVLAVTGAAAMAIGIMLLRSVGAPYRVARLLSATPQVTIPEALELARAAERRYVRLTGRVSSDEEFPDEHDRPLVYRRRRLQAAVGSRWQTLADDREAVPFGIELRSDFIAVDGEALDEGLVVITREAAGKAAELPPDLRGELDPSAGVRVHVDQVSAVEHATAAGVPTLGGDGNPVLSAGLGRPLILTTLDVPAAMRVLAAGQRRRVVAAAITLIGGTALLALSVVTALIFS